MAAAGDFSLLIAETPDVYDRCSGMIVKKGLRYGWNAKCPPTPLEEDIGKSKYNSGGQSALCHMLQGTSSTQSGGCWKKCKHLFDHYLV